MHICIVVDSLGGGGAEHVAVLLSSGLVTRGERVTLLTFSSGDDRFYDVDACVDLVQLGVARTSRNFCEAVVNNLWRVYRVRRKIRKLKPDCVLSLADKTNVTVLLSLIATDIPTVISERIDPTQYSPGWWWERLRSRVYPTAKLLVVQTSSVLEWGKKIMGHRPVVVIPNAAAMPSSHEGPLCVDLPSGNLIVSMGRLTTQKGFDILIRAFAEIAATCPDWSVVILGEGETRKELERLAVTLGIANRVRLVGSLRHPEQVLRRAKLFALPSRFEGFPNALLEAMALGLPVISTDCRSGPSDIIEHGVNGILVRTEDVRALATSMQELILDTGRRGKLGTSARGVIERFSQEHNLTLWQSALTLAMEPRKCG
jgi:GalNAc-alpha-(1->4)-GalNAc-alpha-(1->3)-diNAcBac-PP-undecaprenol alpha-1,4-N-acetyl-D-galactosaminyltransferase